MNTKIYWTNRYKTGGNSGAGSYNDLYILKRDIINDIISKKDIKSIIDFGCGDGNQIKEINIKKYIGFDIADSSINICKKKYNDDKTKEFYNYNMINSIDMKSANLTLSLDVLYHILEDDLFIDYIKNLFNYSNNYVLIYSSNVKGTKNQHIYTRKFTDYISNLFPNWQLIKKIDQKYPTKSSADFYLYKKVILLT